MMQFIHENEWFSSIALICACCMTCAIWSVVKDW